MRSCTTGDTPVAVAAEAKTAVEEAEMVATAEERAKEWVGARLERSLEALEMLQGCGRAMKQTYPHCPFRMGKNCAQF